MKIKANNNLTIPNLIIRSVMFMLIISCQQAYCQQFHINGFTVVINEYPKDGQEIVKIKVDINSKPLTFSIKSQSPNEAFAIDSCEGKVMVNNSVLFKYSTNPKLTAIVQIKNGNTTTEVTLNVSLNKLQGVISISDENFRKALLTHNPKIDTNLDNVISKEEARAVTSLYIDEKKISDLAGIEYFTSLKYLSCSYNYLTSLNLGKNTSLEKLSCIENEIVALNISSNIALRELYCTKNLLSSLDLSKNIILEILECSKNKLILLDLNNNIDLTGLFCNNNQLSSLNLSKNSELELLDCSNNKLRYLNLNNGKNSSLYDPADMSGNPYLNCVVVDNPTAPCLRTWKVDKDVKFSNSCQ